MHSGYTFYISMYIHMMLVMEVKVKAMWHTAKYGDPYSEFVLCINPSKVHTHFSEVNTHTTHVNTPGAVRSHLCCGDRGAVGGLVPCSRAPCCGFGGGRALYIHSPHLQFLPNRDSNSQPFDYEPDSLNNRPRLPIVMWCKHQNVLGFKSCTR